MSVDTSKAGLSPQETEAVAEDLRASQREPQAQALTAAEQRAAEISAAKAERAAAKAQQAPAKDLAAAKAPPKPPLSDPARRAQQIIRSIDERQRERAMVVADNNSRKVEIDRIEHEEKEALAAALLEVQEEAARKELVLRNRYADGVQARFNELAQRQEAVVKLDHSLEQLRKHLAAELAKVDPALAGGKEGA